MTDTIAAISTPHGRGGIAVIRISGSDAIGTADRMFLPVSGKKLADVPSHKAVYGKILSDGRTIDDGIATVFRAPASYTGEDTVEISCHGGILISSKVLAAAYAAGARAADAGEFTRRAFVSGRLTLTEAEAVIDLIDASTEEQLRLARSHVSGRLSAQISELYEELRTIVSSVYVYADYPDEDLADMSRDEMRSALVLISDKLKKLADSYESARMVREGVRAVLAGRPNTGKSSVLNRLLDFDRAIVSGIAGTTRDTIEENVRLGSVLLALTDTAGIREGDDPIEKIGVERSLRAIEGADLIFAVFDGSTPLTCEDTELISLISTKKCPKIALVNKSDLGIPKITDDLSDCGFEEVIGVSAKDGNGFDRITQIVGKLFDTGRIDYDENPMIANERQKATVMRALESVGNAISALDCGFTPDVAGLDIEQAMGALGETDGRAVSADIVDAVFHRFCVGK